MKAKKTEILLRHPREATPVPIVADAALSTVGLHGGKMLPVLLLDTSNRPDVAEFIRVHESLGPGDVEFQWGKIEGHEGTVALFLKFIRPIELFLVLEFDIVRQGILVDQALTGQGIYIARANGAGDRLKYDIDRPKVIVEVADTGFRQTWDELLKKHLVKHFRQDGLGRHESRRAARSLIQELRKIGSLRIRDTHD
jgi:hypothetical protein